MSRKVDAEVTEVAVSPAAGLATIKVRFLGGTVAFLGAEAREYGRDYWPPAVGDVVEVADESVRIRERRRTLGKGGA